MIKLLFLEPYYRFLTTFPTPFPLLYNYLNTKNTYEAIKVDDLTCLLSNKINPIYTLV